MTSSWSGTHCRLAAASTRSKSADDFHSPMSPNSNRTPSDACSTGLVEHRRRVVDADHLGDVELLGGQRGQLPRPAPEIDGTLDRRRARSAPADRGTAWARSSANRRYCSGFQSGMTCIVLVSNGAAVKPARRCARSPMEYGLTTRPGDRPCPDTIEGGEMATSSTPFAPVTAAHDLVGDPRPAARGDPHRRAAAGQPRARRAATVRAVRRRPHVGSRGDPGPHGVGIPRTARQPPGRRRTACPRSASPATRRRSTSARRWCASCSRCGARSSRRCRSSPLAGPPTPERADIAELAARSTNQLDEFRTIDRAFHTAISRACGNPLLQEVYGKTLGALFDSGELASLLYAEINRREVAASSPRRPRPIARSPTRWSPADARQRSRRCKPTSTTSNDE